MFLMTTLTSLQNDYDRLSVCSFHIPEIRKATISPHAYAAHPTEADKPEECSLPLMRFVCRIFGTQLWNIFSFLLS